MYGFARILWICWFQGVETAPPIVRACIERWHQENPDWDIRIVTTDNISTYTDMFDEIDLSHQTIAPAALSDILRVHLLARHGGVWADATTYCNKPLDSWLPEAVREGFFAFDRPAPGRPISSWFLAANADNLIIQDMLLRVRHYWASRTEVERYYWFHGLFRNMLRRNSQAAELWAKVPKFSSQEAHAFQKMMNLPMSRAPQQIDWSPPIFKLTYKLPYIRQDALVRTILDIDKWEAAVPQA